MAISKRKFRIVGPLVSSLALAGIGALSLGSLASSAACGQEGTVTGEKLAADSEMKTVVINIFGMT
ncbi:MAG: hypothetical protein JKY56_24665 [Kofleriaceae bacterium]|nr:hypothetical protein [Kofleriaceae bacterium]